MLDDIPNMLQRAMIAAQNGQYHAVYALMGLVELELERHNPNIRDETMAAVQKELDRRKVKQ